MPNIKSAKKRVEISASRRIHNRMEKSALRTAVKEVFALCEAGDKDAASDAYVKAAKKVDQAAAKNLIHKNKAAHQKSAMALAINRMA